MRHSGQRVMYVVKKYSNLCTCAQSFIEIFSSRKWKTKFTIYVYYRVIDEANHALRWFIISRIVPLCIVSFNAAADAFKVNDQLIIWRVRSAKQPLTTSCCDASNTINELALRDTILSSPAVVKIPKCIWLPNKRCLELSYAHLS